MVLTGLKQNAQVHASRLDGVKLSSLVKIKNYVFHLEMDVLIKIIQNNLSTIHTQNPIESHLRLEKQSTCGTEDANTIYILSNKTSMETGLLTHVLQRPKLLLGPLVSSSVTIIKCASYLGMDVSKLEMLMVQKVGNITESLQKTHQLQLENYQA